MAAAATSSSPSSPPPPPSEGRRLVKYDVFLSFRGDDTRSGFTSHLYKALEGKQILTFIDKELERGYEISPSLLKAIDESKLSVLIFSENYASSKWCLEELVKILECRKNGHIVVPIFYKVDPSHVRNQLDSFGDAFDRLIEEKALTIYKVQRFREALKDAGNLSGWPFTKSESEAEFVEKIVEDILIKLHKMPSSQSVGVVGIDAMGLVGIDARVEKTESLLNMESEDVHIVGIWGMGGIGKTTIAQAVCQKNRSQFEKIFFANFREHSMADLERRFLSQLLGQEILNIGFVSFRDSFIWDRLRRMKVLIVIDNVDNSMQLKDWPELICRQHYSLGKGSKILVTSRDKQLLKGVVGEERIYEVERLNPEEALRLFSMKAFKDRNPTIDHGYLLERAVNVAHGNPLALKVLGSALFDKSNEEWDSALNKLARDPGIENVLRISYDGLDRDQQSIFLDIACFYEGWEQNRATRVLEGCNGPSVLFDISTLVDKCLLTVSHNCIRTHALLQEMALSIVRAESKNPGKRSRLSDVDGVVHVFKKKKGTHRIEGIYLDMSKISEEMHLESNAFAKMDDLRFLEFNAGVEANARFKYDAGFHFHTNKVHLPSSGFKKLSDELRYLRWDGFPSKVLSQNLCAKNLVELKLIGSKVEKLWTEAQDLENLRDMDLRGCKCLKELPDLLKANNLEMLRLEGCESLIEVPSSVQCLEKLEVLDLGRCYNLGSPPSRFDSKVLRELTITDCSKMIKCPEIISGKMERLDLSETAIEEVPSSITSTLQRLFLSGCSNVTKFPEVSEDIKFLSLGGTAIEEVPSSIQSLTRLIQLDMSGCSNVTKFPEVPKGIIQLYLGGTAIEEVPYSIQSLTKLQTLDMSGCSKLESFPDVMESMTSLWELYLDETGIKELPSSIKHRVSLIFLHINGTPIRELLELPPKLSDLRASDCASLETVLITNLTSSWLDWLDFSNCFKLDQKAVIADMLLKIQSKQRRIKMVLPGREIPEWFSNQGVGSSVTIRLPSNCQQLIKGFAFCLVVLIPSHDFIDKREPFMRFDANVKVKNGGHDEMLPDSTVPPVYFYRMQDGTDHMILKYEPMVFENKYSGKEVTFEFGGRMSDYIKRCGVEYIFSSDEDEDISSSDEDLK